MDQKFRKHVFVCLNQSEKNPENCCAPKGAHEVLDALKLKLKSMNLYENIRINKAGCLSTCSQGLSLVIYPQGIWYGHVTLDDVDEIIEKSLIRDEVIERLRIT